MLEVDNIKILLLECEMYNFSPDYKFEVDVFTVHHSKVIHFKGKRKKYMATYWDYNFANFSNEQLKDVIKQLQDNRYKLLNDISQLNQKKSILTTKLLSARNELEVMKSSKFWKLRQQWFKIKDFFTQTRKTI